MKQTKRNNRRNNVRVDERSKITPMTIEDYIRGELRKSDWVKKDSKCYVSGRTYRLEKHHNGKAFSTIMKETFKKLNITYKPYMTQYDIVELAQIKNEIIRVHKNTDYVTLNAEIHSELHKRYGRQVSKKQLEAFKAEYQANNNTNQIA